MPTAAPDDECTSEMVRAVASILREQKPDATPETVAKQVIHALNNVRRNVRRIEDERSFI